MRSGVGAAWPLTRVLFFLLEDLEVPLLADFDAGALPVAREAETCEPAALELL